MPYDFYAAGTKEHGDSFDVWMQCQITSIIFGCFYEHKYLINYLKKSEFKPFRRRL